MTKSAFWISCLLCLAALSTIAAGPPNIDKALEAQYELVAERPYEASAHNDLGNLLALVNRWDDAAQAYQKAIDLDPGDTSARFNLALLHAQQGRLAEAEAELKTVLELVPNHGRALYQLGVIYGDKGERNNAINAYAKAFAADPTLTFASNNPHIIENEYRMEALLTAERFEVSAETQQPRVYQDPDRIRDLMVAVEESAAEAAEEVEPTEEEVPFDPEDDPGFRSEPQDAEDDPGYQGASQVERGKATSGRAQTQEGQPATSRPSATPTRTRRRPSGVGAGSSYRPPSRSTGQVGGVSRPQGSQRRQGTANTNRGSRSEGEFSDDSGRPEYQAPVPSARPRRVGRVGYSTGRASTGRLDLDLLPLEQPGDEDEITVASRR